MSRTISPSLINGAMSTVHWPRSVALSRPQTTSNGSYGSPPRSLQSVVKDRLRDSHLAPSMPMMKGLIAAIRIADTIGIFGTDTNKISPEEIKNLISVLYEKKAPPVLSPDRIAEILSKARQTTDLEQRKKIYLIGLLQREMPIPEKTTGKAEFVNFGLLKSESDRVAAADLVMKQDWAQKALGEVQKGVVLADDNFGRIEKHGLVVVDHHGKYMYEGNYKPQQNATMRLLDRYEAALVQVGVYAVVNRPTDEQVDNAINILDIRQIATTNGGDGGKCGLLARHQRFFLKHKYAMDFLRKATDFEDNSAFGSTINADLRNWDQWVAENPAIVYQSAVFQRYNEIYYNHNVQGSDRFPAEKTTAIMEDMAQAEWEMFPKPENQWKLSDKTIELAKTFWLDIQNTVQLLDHRKVKIYDDGLAIIFNLGQLRDIYQDRFEDKRKEGYRKSLQIFTQWLAVPRAHRRPLQITANPKMVELSSDQGDSITVSGHVLIAAIPFGRELPSGQGLDESIPVIEAAEKKAASNRGASPNNWFGKPEVALNVAGSLLRPYELASILTDAMFHFAPTPNSDSSMQHPLTLVVNQNSRDFEKTKINQT